MIYITYNLDLLRQIPVKTRVATCERNALQGARAGGGNSPLGVDFFLNELLKLVFLGHYFS